MYKKINEKTYVELFYVLNLQKEIFENKIPKDIIDNIHKKAQNSNIHVELDENNVINEISREAFCIYLFLYTKYVADEEEKENIKKILKENEIKHEEELRKKYNPDNIFKKSEKILNDENSSVAKDETKNVTDNDLKEETYLTVYKESIFDKIKKKIFSLLKKSK